MKEDLHNLVRFRGSVTCSQGIVQICSSERSQTHQDTRKKTQAWECSSSKPQRNAPNVIIFPIQKCGNLLWNLLFRPKFMRICTTSIRFLWDLHGIITHFIVISVGFPWKMRLFCPFSPGTALHWPCSSPRSWSRCSARCWTALSAAEAWRYHLSKCNGWWCLIIMRSLSIHIISFPKIKKDGCTPDTWDDRL